MTGSLTLLRGALFASAALLAAPGWAQSADDVATRLQALYEAQAGAETSFVYGEASETGGVVTLSDVALTVTVEGETSAWKFGRMEVEGADLARKNALTADRIDVFDLALDSGLGETRIAAVRSEDAVLTNTNGFLLSYAGESVLENLDQRYEGGGGFSIAEGVVRTEFDADTLAFSSQTGTIDGILAERDDFTGEHTAPFEIFQTDAFRGNAAYTAEWDAATGTFILSDLTLSEETIGTLAISVGVGNISPALMKAAADQNLEQLQALGTALTLVNLSLSMENGPGFDDAVANMAERVGMSEEAYRAQAVQQVIQGFALLGAAPAATAARDALVDYLKGDADSIEIAATPAAPTPFVAIGMTAFTAPASAFALLGLSVTAD